MYVCNKRCVMLHHKSVATSIFLVHKVHCGTHLVARVHTSADQSRRECVDHRTVFAQPRSTCPQSSSMPATSTQHTQVAAVMAVRGHTAAASLPETLSISTAGKVWNAQTCSPQKCPFPWGMQAPTSIIFLAATLVGRIGGDSVNRKKAAAN